MPQSDTLHVIAKSAATTAEPVQATSADWLVAFVQAYVWQEPRAVIFMLIAYAISLMVKLNIVYKAGTLTPKSGGKDFLSTFFNFISALVLLYLAFNIGHFTTYLTWFPESVYTAIMLGVFLQITNNLSSLGYITPALHETIEGRLNIHKKKNETADAQNATQGLEADLGGNQKEAIH